MNKSTNDKNSTNPSLRITHVRRSALEWWNSLSESRKRDEEFQTFGYGEPWEDNTLTDADIETMYMRK